MKAVFAHDHIFLHDGCAYYSKSGLPQAVLRRYADAFDAVEVICRSTTIDSTVLEPINDSRIRFHPQRNLRSLRGMFNYLQVRREVARVVGGADLLVARLPSLLGSMAVQEARLRGIPYAVEVVGNAYEANNLHGSRLGWLTAPIEHWLTARDVLQSNNAIYITSHYLQSIYPTRGRYFVCPNVKVQPVPESRLEQRLVGLQNKQKRKIGLIGSLDVNYKGHRTALKTLRALRESYGILDVEIVFAGGGDQRRWSDLAEKLGVAEHVRFTGSIPSGDMVLKWLEGIDLLLQPSLTEGQGRSIIEGMSCGCPVVASRVGGIPELLDPTMVTEPDDVAGLAQRCADLLKIDTLYAEQARRNWLVAHRFCSDAVEQVRREIFKSLRSEIDIAKK
jgi:glycosyltransferase involved in cell wall biosynthesis